MAESPPTAEPSADWNGVLSYDEWLSAARVLGNERLDELHTLMTAAGSTLRRQFIAEIATIGNACPEGQAVVLALASAIDISPQRAQRLVSEGKVV